MSYFSLFHENLLVDITIARNTVVDDINFKKLNFKTLTKTVLLSTMFIQRADNLAKLIGMRISLTSANWEHNVQQCYAPFTMIDNVSYVSRQKIFPSEWYCTFCFAQCSHFLLSRFIDCFVSCFLA